MSSVTVKSKNGIIEIIGDSDSLKDLGDNLIAKSKLKNNYECSININNNSERIKLIHECELVKCLECGKSISCNEDTIVKDGNTIHSDCCQQPLG